VVYSVLVHSSSTQIVNSPVKQRKATVKIFREGHFSDSADCAERRGSIVVRKEIDLRVISSSGGDGLIDLATQKEDKSIVVALNNLAR
jgi:hypothetical protein